MSAGSAPRVLAVPLVLAGVAAALSPVTASAGITAAAAATPPCVAVTGAPAPSAAGDLIGVTVLTACSAWAVADGGQIEHYDGADWAPQPVPSPPSSDFIFLEAVAGLSVTNVWATGGYKPSAAPRNQPLIEHWNGSAWSVSPTPTVTNGDADLKAVAASSAADAWAVGSVDTRTATSTVSLADHWNGTSWTQVPSPNPGAGTVINGVADISPTNAWMVGNFGTGDNTALIEHWDGTSWTVATTPSLPVGSSLNAVSALSATNIWAAGVVGTSTLIEHYDGTSWTVVPSPSTGSGNTDTLNGVAVTGTGAMAVGTSQDASGVFHGLALRLDGTTWAQVPIPSPGTNDLIAGVDGTSNNYWAVGLTVDSSGRRLPLALHCC